MTNIHEIKSSIFRRAGVKPLLVRAIVLQALHLRKMWFLHWNERRLVYICFSLYILKLFDFTCRLLQVIPVLQVAQMILPFFPEKKLRDRPEM